MATTTTETTETTATTEHAAKPGMPQLDTTTWVPQLFWLAVTFIVLYLIVSRLIIPKTGGTIEKRKTTVESDLAAAARHRTETDSVAKAYEAVLEDARSKAHATMAAARNALNDEMQVANTKLDGELSQKMVEAEKSVAAAKAKALSSIEAVAADIASSIVTQLTGASVSEADSASAVRNASNQG
jgi:F-type H+-transporting ATPase subunit b